MSNRAKENYLEVIKSAIERSNEKLECIDELSTQLSNISSYSDFINSKNNMIQSIGDIKDELLESHQLLSTCFILMQDYQEKIAQKERLHTSSKTVPNIISKPVQEEKEMRNKNKEENSFEIKSENKPILISKLNLQSKEALSYMQPSDEIFTLNYDYTKPKISEEIVSDKHSKATKSDIKYDDKVKSAKIYKKVNEKENFNVYDNIQIPVALRTDREETNKDESMMNKENSKIINNRDYNNSRLEDESLKKVQTPKNEKPNVVNKTIKTPEVDESDNKEIDLLLSKNSSRQIENSKAKESSNKVNKISNLVMKIYSHDDFQEILSQIYGDNFISQLTNQEPDDYFIEEIEETLKEIEKLREKDDLIEKEIEQHFKNNSSPTGKEQYYTYTNYDPSDKSGLLPKQRIIEEPEESENEEEIKETKDKNGTEMTNPNSSNSLNHIQNRFNTNYGRFSDTNNMKSQFSISTDNYNTNLNTSTDIRKTKNKSKESTVRNNDNYPGNIARYMKPTQGGISHPKKIQPGISNPNSIDKHTFEKNLRSYNPSSPSSYNNRRLELNSSNHVNTLNQTAYNMSYSQNFPSRMSNSSQEKKYASTKFSASSSSATSTKNKKTVNTNLPYYQPIKRQVSEPKITKTNKSIPKYSKQNSNKLINSTGNYSTAYDYRGFSKL